MTAVGGDEHHMRAFLVQHPHQVEQPQGARIPVGLRSQCINYQHRLAAAGGGGLVGVAARCGLQCQPGTPLVREDSLIAHLVGLGAVPHVGAGGDALQMHDTRGRLVTDFQAGFADGKGEIGVLEVGRRVALIEAAQLVEQGQR